jgi:hypothetical protein
VAGSVDTSVLPPPDVATSSIARRQLRAIARDSLLFHGVLEQREITLDGVDKLAIGSREEQARYNTQMDREGQSH